ncbi:MAG: biotin/lipoyl-containing protein [Gammaproteobacteria bacterium]
MSTEIKAPQFPEAVADGTVATWHKKPGDSVSRDELLVDIETDKVVLEVVAPHDGVLAKVLKNEGDTVLSQEVIAFLEQASAGAAKAAESAPAAKAEAAPAADADQVEDNWGPAVRKLIAENNLDPAHIKGTGKGGRITKEDVLAHLKGGAPAKAEAKPQVKPEAPKVAAAAPVAAGEREERRVPMTRLRARVAERLVAAQHNAAMLTTFNEVNMKPVMDMRKNYKDLFEKAHMVRALGFMSFFVRAAVEALKEVPGCKRFY